LTNAIEIKGLTKEYKGFKLNNVSFSLPKGCIMGMIGENGAGKTTTIKLILNLIKRDSGNIHIYGMDNIKDEIEIKKRMGVVLDDSSFHDTLNIKDISKIMRFIYKTWDEKLFIKYLDRLKIPNDKTIKELSKGMKTKLSIAVALSHNPDILILDEPTSGLDPVVRNEILDLFMDFIQNEEKSVLLSTHITSDLEKIADYITFIQNGEVVLSKSKDEILNNYGIIKCRDNEFSRIEKQDLVTYRKNKFETEVLIKDKALAKRKYAGMIIDNITLEELMLFHIRGEVV